MAPHAHTATTVTYRALVPSAGTVCGVHLPSLWPKGATVVLARWVTGENVVIGTVELGPQAPARALRLIRFWCRGRESLEITYGIDPRDRLPAPVMARTPSQLPVILLVHPAETGLAKAVRWAQGGMARLGRAATP
jgi:hypothetical protein